MDDDPRTKRLRQRRAKIVRLMFQLLTVLLICAVTYSFYRAEEAEAEIDDPLIHVIVLACNRPETLDLALETWANVDGIATTPITVSTDCRHEQTEIVVQKWQASSALKHLRLVHSFQADIIETGAQQSMTDERVTRHWLSAVNRIFANGAEHVIYAEDDHIVTPDFLKSALRIIAAKDSLCPACFSINMGCRGDCWGRKSSDPLAVIRMESGNTGVIYERAKWKGFIAQIDTYCNMLGIWDINLHIMGALGKVSPLALTYLASRIHHLTTCYSSRTGIRRQNVNCDHRSEVDSFVASIGNHGTTLKDNGRAWFNVPSPNYPRADDTTRRRCLEAPMSIAAPPASRISY